MHSALVRTFLKACPMRVVHAIAEHQASRARAMALAQEGAHMAEVTALGRTAFLASRARRAEVLAPQQLYSAELEELFESRVFAASLVRAQLPLQALQVKAGVEEDDSDDMPPWLGIGSSTAYFDARLDAALADGTRQVVSLGSGLDCRALRMEQPSETIWVEVDEGPLLDFKVNKITAAGHKPYPATIVRGSYLQMDLLEELQKVGVDAAKPVFFLWEANTMYLHPAESRAFLGKLLSGFPQCTVIFDYFTEPVASTTGPRPTGCASTDMELELVVRAIGDGEWLLIGPWDAEATRSELGFQVMEDLSLPDVIRLVRGDEIAGPLLKRHQREFEVGLHACQRFSVVRPSSGPDGSLEGSTSQGEEHQVRHSAT